MSTEKNEESIRAACTRLLEILLELAVRLASSGAHAGKTIRIVKRIAKAYGFEAHVMMQTKSLSLTLVCADNHLIQTTAIRHIPGLAINFYYQNEISRLSWKIFDEGMDLRELDSRFREIVGVPRYNPYLVVLTTSLANMAFCRLFSGDFYAMLFVFLGTFCACLVRRFLSRFEINHLFVVVIAAFVSSAIAGCTEFFLLGKTSAIALATSVLFMIPGVPLLNSLIEILEGHVLNGIEKLMNACTTIVCIALGLLITLTLLGIDNL